jgi:RNA recognition motif-containing protein
MKLIALNLPRDFTEDELAKLFKNHGNIKSCSLVFDGNTGASKGFGFVEMALKHEGLAAIDKIHGTIVNKNKIRVKQAN